MKSYIVDTNLILRFLTGEPVSQAKLAAEFFQQGENDKILLHISPIVVAETVFVLTGKIYGCAKADVYCRASQFVKRKQCSCRLFRSNENFGWWHSFALKRTNGAMTR